MPHLTATAVIEPIVQHPVSHVNPGSGAELNVLIPGNLAVNKGYLDLRRIIEQAYDLGLPIKFRVLGRVEAWIKHELSTFENVELLGRYNTSCFMSKAEGTDLALFLSPWPETYCMTFDEWKYTGRPCFIRLALCQKPIVCTACTMHRQVFLLKIVTALSMP